MHSNTIECLFNFDMYFRSQITYDAFLPFRHPFSILNVTFLLIFPPFCNVDPRYLNLETCGVTSSLILLLSFVKIVIYYLTTWKIQTLSPSSVPSSISQLTVNTLIFIPCLSSFRMAIQI